MYFLTPKMKIFPFTISAVLRTVLTSPRLIRATPSTNHGAAELFELSRHASAEIAAGALPHRCHQKRGSRHGDVSQVAFGPSGKYITRPPIGHWVNSSDPKKIPYGIDRKTLRTGKMMMAYNQKAIMKFYLFF